MGAASDAMRSIDRKSLSVNPKRSGSCHRSGPARRRPGGPRRISSRLATASRRFGYIDSTTTAAGTGAAPPSTRQADEQCGMARGSQELRATDHLQPARPHAMEQKHGTLAWFTGCKPACDGAAGNGGVTARAGNPGGTKGASVRAGRVNISPATVARTAPRPRAARPMMASLRVSIRPGERQELPSPVSPVG